LEFKDYYAILGVKPEATAKEIKKTYQTLAKKYHPDVNPGDKQAEDKFKEVNEAYHAVSDPAKRQKYDELRQDYNDWQRHGGKGHYDWEPWQSTAGSGGGRSDGVMTPEEFAEIFGDLGLGGRSGFGADPGAGAGQSHGFSDFFAKIFAGFETEKQEPFNPYYSIPIRGRDVTGEAEITLEEAFSGTNRPLSINQHRIEAHIPAGVKDNMKLRLAGQGEAGSGGGERGDLYLKVLLRPHPRYERSGDDLLVKAAINFYEAILGTTIPIETLSGSVMLRIPPQTQGGRKFRLKGKGMPHMGEKGTHGDLIVSVDIVLPEDMSEEETKAIQKIYEKRR
jgi:curved DNA-binding protein